MKSNFALDFARSGFAALVISLCVLVCTVGLIAPKLPRQVVGRPAVSPEYVAQFPAVPRVVLHNMDGPVHVHPQEDGDAVLLRGEAKIYTRDWGTTADAAAYAHTLHEVTEHGRSLEVVSEPLDRPDNLEVIIHYTLQVPHGTDLEITSMNGNVFVGPGAGMVTVKGRNADIDVRSPQGAVFAESINGRIRVRNAGGSVHAETLNGRIFAEVMNGTLRARTNNGDVNAVLAGDMVESCDLNTLNGTITVTLPHEGSARLDARTARGQVRTDCLVDSSDGVERRGHLKGRIGQGDIDLTMGTLNGDIIVTRSSL